MSSTRAPPPEPPAPAPDHDRPTLPPAAPADVPTMPPDPAGADTRPGAAAPDRPGGPGVVPGYEVLGELGRGGMGVVYRARDTRLNRPVALKMVVSGPTPGPRTGTGSWPKRRRWRRSTTRTWSGCSGTGSTPAARTWRWSCPPAAALVGKLARGVAAAHDQGIVHRDLKPRNAVLDGAGEPKVTDFGPAKRGGGGDLTRTQAVVGTPAYMAPEQAAGRTKFVGPEADVYALGVILYECLAGRPPFEAEDPIALTMKVVEEEPPPLSRFVKGVSRDPETICRKCLRKAPHERYAGAAELADDLGRFVRGEPIAARPPGPLERASRWVRRNRVVAGATAVVLALVTGAAVSLAFGLHTSRQMRK